MIDFHTHILPNMDDGAKDIEMAKNMLILENDQGVNDIVLTPHFYCGRNSIDEFLIKREDRYNLLKIEANTLNINLIKGAEVNIEGYESNDFSIFSKLKIEGTKYILLELPFSIPWDEKLFSTIEKISSFSNLTPIIAHIEKYHHAIKKSKNVNSLIDLGCIFQINSNFIDNRFETKFIKKLVKTGNVHCFGTDTHNIDHRPPRYNSALEYLSDKFGREFLTNLQMIMRDIIDGNRLDFFRKHL